jgi:hypothetical protein
VLSLSSFWRKCSRTRGAVLAHAGDERGAEVLDEAVAGSQGERTDERSEIELALGTEDGFRIFDELAHAIA